MSTGQLTPQSTAPDFLSSNQPAWALYLIADYAMSLSRRSRNTKPSHILGAMIPSTVRSWSMRWSSLLGKISSTLWYSSDILLKREFFGSMRFAYISVDTERNTAETWGSDLCFLRGFVLRIQLVGSGIVSFHLFKIKIDQYRYLCLASSSHFAFASPCLFLVSI